MLPAASSPLGRLAGRVPLRDRGTQEQRRGLIGAAEASQEESCLARVTRGLYSNAVAIHYLPGIAAVTVRGVRLSASAVRGRHGLARAALRPGGEAALGTGAFEAPSRGREAGWTRGGS